jgi:hypothetical protein
VGEFGGVIGCFPPICGKRFKVTVKTMFGHKEFGGQFEKYSLMKCNSNVWL